VNANDKLKVLIVDDEPLGRERVRTILSADPRVTVVGESGTGADAVADIGKVRPDLVLLDIQMPGMSGFDVVAAVGAEHMPAVIFVTAFDEYAIRAFDVNAIDYVLKPVDPERLRLAVDRAVQAIAEEPERWLELRMAALLSSVQTRETYATRIPVPDKGGAILLQVADIDWVETAGNYIKVHSSSSSYLLRESLASFAQRLDPREFMRVHRSALVNVASIKRIDPWSRGEYSILLRNGTRLTSSRAHGQALRDLLG
jgi:two-component system LytT family response regulator